MQALQKPRGLFRTGAGAALPHDSAAKHVTGAAIYVDDMPEPPRTLHAALVLSSVAHGTLRGIKLCWLGRISLSATGFYRTPDLHWDRETMTGSPFFYFSYGASVAEVAVDTLTGEARVLRADLVQDCGRPLNPAIDLGQIEGAFVQGMGWLTNEELWWDGEGKLRTVGPSTYKIPGSRDVPPIFNARILENAPARAATIFRSKGIGEPPLLLAIAVWSAIRDAIGSLADHRLAVDLDAPATPERILNAVIDLQQRAARANSATPP